LKAILNKIGTGIIIAIFLFIIIKECILTLVHFNEISIYEQIDSKGQSSKVYVVPRDKIILKKQYGDLYEYGVFKVSGEAAIHYFGSLYNSGVSPFGVRIYSNATEVWKVKMELLAKNGNLDKSSFDEIGNSYKDLIIFRDNSVKIGELDFDKTNKTIEDEVFIKSVIKTLK
jgi:hypothetical protein